MIFTGLDRHRFRLAAPGRGTLAAVFAVQFLPFRVWQPAAILNELERVLEREASFGGEEILVL